MIYAELKGNIGNQMFIYACARQLQICTNQKIQLNTYYLNRRYGYDYQLDIFKLNENVEVSDVKLPMYTNTSSRFYRLYRKITHNLKIFEMLYYYFFSLFNIYVCDSVEYFPIKIKNKKKDIYISGFFQSEKYFQNIRNEILKDFELNDQLTEKNSAFLEIIKKNNSVCVSIRRGDYINTEWIRNKHFVCDDKYFKYAIELIKEKIENPFLVMFSDDPEWVESNYHFNIETIYEKSGNSLADKILLMKNCKNFILSNSTFSWWVQYLSGNEKKIIVAPSKWYVDGRATSIYQNNWEIVDV